MLYNSKWWGFSTFTLLQEFRCCVLVFYFKLFCDESLSLVVFSVYFPLYTGRGYPSIPFGIINLTFVLRSSKVSLQLLRRVDKVTKWHNLCTGRLWGGRTRDVLTPLPVGVKHSITFTMQAGNKDTFSKTWTHTHTHTHTHTNTHTHTHTHPHTRTASHSKTALSFVISTIYNP